MKEYWINVYTDYSFGLAYLSRHDAELGMIKHICIYRIHVRMK